MPISINVTQNSGVVAAYHVVQCGGYNVGSSPILNAEVSSFLSQSAFASGESPICTENVDVSFILSVPAQNPPLGLTIQQVVESIVENALISQPGGIFNGGSIVS